MGGPQGTGAMIGRWVPRLAVVFLCGTAQGQVRDVVDTLYVVPGEQVHCLSHRIVFVSTLRVYLNDDLLPAEEYRLDPKSGCLTLFLSRPGMGVITAAYRAPDFTIPSTFQRLEDPWTTRAPTVRPPQAAPKPGFTPRQDEGLDVRGNQTLGITLGNRRDAKVNQSLDVRIRGRVGENAEILAILSDQDIPFQPEGNTAELEELDQVLVEFKTPRFDAGLGDIDMRFTGPRFLSFSRKAEGVRGDARWLGATSRASFGSLKGAFRREEFFGTDGLQGPYRLEQGQSAVIVAGSETVWLDGVQLSRGQDGDYTVDYNRGEITFTSARPITTHSRITVDYEVSQGSYRRNLLFAGAQDMSLGDGGTLEVAYFSERDDADRALAGDLTPEERAQLQGLGDLAQTVGGGVRYLGPGQGGIYKQVVDSATGKTIFVFVDVGGEYAVDFVPVEEGKGDYAYDPVHASDSRPVFMHVGDGQGDFVVRRDLPAPVSSEVVDLRWGLQGRRGSLRAEGAVSSTDRNTLSALDDGDNHGRALWVEGSLTPLRWGEHLAFTPRILHRTVGEDFRSPSPYQESFQGWAWNLNATPNAGESVSEVQVETAYQDVLSLDHRLGRLSLGDSLEAVRLHQRGRWTSDAALVTGEWLSVDNTAGHATVGHADRITADVRFLRWRVRPIARLLSEERRFPGAVRVTRSREWKGGVHVPLVPERLSVETLVGRRRDQSRPDSTGVWIQEREERSGSVEVKGSSKQVDLTLRYEGREVERSQTNVHHLGRVDLRHRAGQGAWTAQTTWDLGSEAVYRGGKAIVADSTGYFDRFGNYVGAGGGYDVRFLESQGEPELTTSLNMTTRVSWSPRDEADVPPWLRQVAWDGFVFLREASLEPNLGALLSPGRYLDPDHVLDGTLRSRQTFDVFPSNSRAGFKVRHELSMRTYRHRPVEGVPGLLERSSNEELSLVVRYQPAPAWSLEGEGVRGNRRERVEPEGGGGLDQDTRLRSLGLTAGRRFRSPKTSGRISALARFSSEKGEERLAEGITLEPRLQLTFTRRGRIDITGAWKHQTAREGFTAVFGPGAPVLTPGWEVQVRGDVKLWEGVRLSSSLRLDHPQGIDAITEGRFEVRGTF